MSDRYQQHNEVTDRFDKYDAILVVAARRRGADVISYDKGDSAV